MIRRIVTGLLVGAAWIIALRFMPGWLLCVILCIMSAACQMEFYGMLHKGKPRLCSSPFWGITMGTIWLVFCYLFPHGTLGYQYAVWILPTMLFLFLLRVLHTKRIKPIEYTAVTLLGFFYLPFMLSYLIRIAQWGSLEMGQIAADRSGIYLAFFLAAVVKFSDVGGFAFGIPFGKHKLAPAISPKKSWEGLLGGIILSSGVSVGMTALARILPCGGPLKTIPYWVAILFGVILALTGLLGDLVESRFKREAEIKDSAILLPGLGGILDMFDSLVFTPFIFYALLSLFTTFC